MSNKDMKRAFEYHIADAPMLAHALMIGANTARLCGHHQASERMQAYRDQIEILMPGMIDLFDEEVWSNIGALAGQAETIAVRVDISPRDKADLERNNWSLRYSRHAKKCVFVDFTVAGKVKTVSSSVWERNEIVWGDPRAKSVADLIEQMSSIDCKVVLSTECPYD